MENGWIKPCPFCGSSAYINPLNISNPKEKWTYQVVCSWCGARNGGYYKTEEDAKESWNKRVSN